MKLNLILLKDIITNLKKNPSTFLNSRYENLSKDDYMSLIFPVQQLFFRGKLFDDKTNIMTIFPYIESLEYRPKSWTFFLENAEDILEYDFIIKNIFACGISIKNINKQISFLNNTIMHPKMYKYILSYYDEFIYVQFGTQLEYTFFGSMISNIQSIEDVNSLTEFIMDFIIKNQSNLILFFVWCLHVYDLNIPHLNLLTCEKKELKNISSGIFLVSILSVLLRIWDVLMSDEIKADITNDLMVELIFLILKYIKLTVGPILYRLKKLPKIINIYIKTMNQVYENVSDIVSGIQLSISKTSKIYIYQQILDEDILISSNEALKKQLDSFYTYFYGWVRDIHDQHKSEILGKKTSNELLKKETIDETQIDLSKIETIDESPKEDLDPMEMLAHDHWEYHDGIDLDDSLTTMIKFVSNYHDGLNLDYKSYFQDMIGNKESVTWTELSNNYPKLNTDFNMFLLDLIGTNKYTSNIHLKYKCLKYFEPKITSYEAISPDSSYFIKTFIIVHNEFDKLDKYSYNYKKMIYHLLHYIIDYSGFLSNFELHKYETKKLIHIHLCDNITFITSLLNLEKELEELENTNEVTDKDYDIFYKELESFAPKLKFISCLCQHHEFIKILSSDEILPNLINFLNPLLKACFDSLGFKRLLHSIWDILYIYSHIENNKIFSLITSDKLFFRKVHYRTMKYSIFRRKKLPMLIPNKSKKFVDKLLKFKNKEEQEMPEKFLDPITCELIENPILIHDTFVDRSTIERHLLTTETNPFNGLPITLDEINTYNSTPEIIKKINDFNDEFIKWKTGA